RLPIARRLLETTDRAFQVVVSDGWLPALLRTRIIANVAATAMRFEAVRRLAFRSISQIGIRYPASALSRTLPGLPKAAPVAGDRFPWLKLQVRPNGDVEDLYQVLDDTRFNLLDFDHSSVHARLNDRFGDVVRIHRIPQTDHNK